MVLFLVQGCKMRAVSHKQDSCALLLQQGITAVKQQPPTTANVNRWMCNPGHEKKPVCWDCDWCVMLESEPGDNCLQWAICTPPSLQRAPLFIKKHKKVAKESIKEKTLWYSAALNTNVIYCTVELRKHVIWNQYRSQFPVHTQDEEEFSEEMMKGWSTNSILFCKQQNGQCSPTWVAVNILQLPKDKKKHAYIVIKPILKIMVILIWACY